MTRTFIFRGEPYEYFIHAYNSTHFNERCVEVPIVERYCRHYAGAGPVLEVGCVLPHYFPGLLHEVVDWGEKWPGVINQDIATFSPDKKYPLIVSISTIEHVWEMGEEKGLAAFKNIYKLLAPSGRALMTWPINQNKKLDSMLEYLPYFDTGFGEMWFMRRIDEHNNWEECGYWEAKEAKYGSPYRYANAIVIAEFVKPA